MRLLGNGRFVGCGSIGALLLIACAGCRPAGKTSSVHGSVTLDGEPLDQATIAFKPLPGAQGPATSGEIKQGKYTLSSPKGPPIGSNRVEVQAMRGTGVMVKSPLGPPDQLIEMQQSIIPARFNATSELKFEIQPGDNEANFALESR